MKKSLILANVLLGSTILFTGCGGGGGGGPLSSLSKISGVVSDGPIENARVFLDIDNDGVYDVGEPFDITDENGAYEISYVLKPGLEYMLIAEGDSTNLGTSDDIDNLGTPLDFKMFLTVEATGDTDTTSIVGKTYTKNVTPLTFKRYLEDLKTEDSNLPIFDENDNTYTDLNQLVNSTSTDQVSLFQSYILNNTDNSVAVVSNTVSTKNTTKLNNSATSEYIYTLPDNITALSNLKTSLIEGDLVNNIIGITPLIDTKIAFQIMNSYNNSNSVTIDQNGVNATITYTKKDDIVTAVFKENVSTSSVTAEYEGTVIFTNTNNVSTLLSANYTQEHSETSNLNVTNSVNGIIELTQANTDYTLNFNNGSFIMNTPLYGDVDGEVSIKDATAAVPYSSDVNNNTIVSNTTTYTVKTKEEPVKISALYPASLVGTWTGSLTNSCTQTASSMTLSVPDEFTGSWQAQSTNNSTNTTYGTTLTVSGSSITFTDSITTNRTWSTGTIGSSQITGSWTDNVNSCTGSYTLSKQGSN